MLCPVCKNVNLLMMMRSNIEIDYCPNCRGVWLDRGELDKLIELSPQQQPAPQHNSIPQVPNQQQTYQQNQPPQYNHNQQYNQNQSYPGQHHKKHKKEGWLGEMFDFD